MRAARPLDGGGSIGGAAGHRDDASRSNARVGPGGEKDYCTIPSIVTYGTFKGPLREP